MLVGLFRNNDPVHSNLGLPRHSDIHVHAGDALSHVFLTRWSRSWSVLLARPRKSNVSRPFGDEIRERLGRAFW